jgi:Zn-dependent protease
LLQFFLFNIQINVALAIFNLIPIPPLDGSRIAYAAIPPIRPLFDRIEQMGFAVVFIIILFAAPLIGPVLRTFTGAIVQLLVPGLSSLSI